MGDADPFAALCPVIRDWFEAHKRATRDGTRPPGVQTPPPARHTYIYAAGLFDHEPNGREIWDALSYVHSREWPDNFKGGKADQAFDARVRAGRFDLLREWVVVFDERSRRLYSDQDRASVLRAAANAAQRIVNEESHSSDGGG